MPKSYNSTKMRNRKRVRSRVLHRYLDWFKPSDRPILLEFRDYGPRKWLTSKAVALNTPYTANHVARRLRTLRDRGFVEPHPDARAAYRLTELGVAFVDDDLSRADIAAIEKDEDEN